MFYHLFVGTMFIIRVLSREKTRLSSGLQLSPVGDARLFIQPVRRQLPGIRVHINTKINNSLVAPNLISQF